MATNDEMFNFYTAGESHGKGLFIFIEGVPAGLEIDTQFINNELRKRQQGYGRGKRMQIETDTVEIMSGVRFGKATGAPITLWIQNKDYANWENIMDPLASPSDLAEKKAFYRPRPGHADLAGYYKYELTDLRDVLERSSARETAARVAAGAVAKLFLKQFDITLFSHVLVLGGIDVTSEVETLDWQSICNRSEQNANDHDFRCAASKKTIETIKQLIDKADEEGRTLGGRIEAVALNVPPGLGSYVQWDRRLDGKLAQAVMSIQAIKSVSIGQGDIGQTVSGENFHDAIGTQDNHIMRPTNRAGGLEGGVTNGEPVIVQAVMKPISTMRTPLDSVNLKTLEPERAHFERSDVTAVPACGIITEAMMAFILAQSFIEKFSGDTLNEATTNYKAYIMTIENRFKIATQTR